jgi:pyridoxal biosynthesis lyase PdxS
VEKRSILQNTTTGEELAKAFKIEFASGGRNLEEAFRLRGEPQSMLILMTVDTVQAVTIIKKQSSILPQINQQTTEISVYAAKKVRPFLLILPN